MTDPYLADLEFANKANIDAARKFKAERDTYLKALRSIARNTCCEGCQEAKRVALSALTLPDGNQP